MDLIDLGDTSTACEGKNCGLPSSFPDDCSDQDCYWDKPIFGLIELACVTVIYIPLMLFGLLGNILTILVVWLRPHMRSSTYLYLSSMAVSDLLILLLLPLDLYKLWRPRPWPLGDLACKLTMFLSECCTFCTILHITFLSLERYLAVCWPITAKTVVTRRRTRTIIGCLWLGAAVSAAPVLVMVGVEEVGAEELGLLWEGEQGGLPVSGGERGGTHMALLGAGLEAMKFGGEKETHEWGAEMEEFKRSEDQVEPKLEGEHERKQGDKSGMKNEKQVVVESSKGKGRMEFVGDQQNKKKEDEGGGKEESIDASHGRQIDRRECRCTDFAISSGLLSAMMILSNLYFLIPLSILGLVYGLIGRTLWLRPKSSRRDQSHRNTVKMLGVIVLAFVLCWLPFHVGRTIFSLSLGNGADRQEAYADTNPHFDSDVLADVSVDDRDIDIHRVSKPSRHPDSDTHFFDAFTQTGKMTTHTLTETDKRFCDECANTKAKISTHNNDMGVETHLNSHAVTRNELRHANTDAKTLHPDVETNTHMETYNSAHATQHGRSNQMLELHTPNATVRKMQNRTAISITAQNVLTYHIPPTASTNIYSAGHTELYIDYTHNSTNVNSTYTHPDTHMYFLYYLSQYFNLVSSVLFYLSAAVNPLLYNLMSARYRLAVQSLIHKHSQIEANRLQTLTARHSTTTL